MTNAYLDILEQCKLNAKPLRVSKASKAVALVNLGMPVTDAALAVGLKTPASVYAALRAHRGVQNGRCCSCGQLLDAAVLERHRIIKALEQAVSDTAGDVNVSVVYQQLADWLRAGQR